MKRSRILKILEKAGFTFKEGGNHTKAYDRDGRYRAAIPRHNEIKEMLAALIEKQTGVKF